MLTITELSDQIREAGIEKGDAVMVHASLRRIGPVENGAEGVVSALDRAVGPRGTVFMTLGADDPFAWVNDRPEEEREEALADAEPFDCLSTPAAPDIGVLAEIFRRQPGTLVSDHPEGRFAARGEHAAHLVRSQPWDDYYGPGSPLERFVELDGRVLRLGADPDTVTLLHYAEYLADIPSKRTVTRHRKVVGESGPEVRVIRALDDSNGIAEWRGSDYFVDILSEFIATGGVRTGVVGGAVSELFDARAMVDFGVEWMERNLGERKQPNLSYP